ncbi:hypothetical protein L0Y69_01200 [bacterium]|nr:hypothetical protein [bacterium]
MFPSDSFDTFFKGIGLVFDTAPFWVPLFLGALLYELWFRYIQTDWIAGMKWILLEVRLPQNINKTPLAMEVIFTGLFQTNPGNPYEQRVLGQVTRWFSLEIVSLGGDVRFFIRTIDKYRNLIESRVYSQYPGVEIYETDDYVHEVEYHGNGSPWNIWGTDYILAKPDPYPIRTYIDYELDKQTYREEQEEAKIDPLVSLIEFFSTINKDERLWFQIILRASKKEWSVPGQWFGKRDWRGEAKDLAAKLKEAGQNDIVKAVERSADKHGFDVGIRSIYAARPEVFDSARTGGLRVALEPFSSAQFNSFKRVNTTDNETPFKNYDWDISWDPTKWKFRNVERMKKKIFNAYVARSWFYPPYKNRYAPFILNSEELATIYHFPGRVLQTPLFTRVSTKKSEPPGNLPI